MRPSLFNTKQNMIPKFASFDIVFQEIPNEVTLAINLTNCPFRCAECHSAHLQEDIGTELTILNLDKLILTYGKSISCVCFMGGDATPFEIADLAAYLHANTKLKTAWYSGRKSIPENYPTEHFDFIKIGPYIKELGGLDSKTTNQRLYQILNNTLTDITFKFWK